jgi:ribosome-associated protein
LSEVFEDEDPDFKSKSERKREFKQYQVLARKMLTLPDAQLAQMPISESFADRLRAARGLTKSALQRELRFLGKHVSESDPEAIEAQISRIEHAHDVNTFEFKRLERWRDRLVEDDEAAATEEIVAAFAAADRQQIRQLARNARRERERAQPPKSSRALFRYLASL